MKSLVKLAGQPLCRLMRLRAGDGCSATFPVCGSAVYVPLHCAFLRRIPLVESFAQGALLAGGGVACLRDLAVRPLGRSHARPRGDLHSAAPNPTRAERHCNPEIFTALIDDPNERGP